MLLYLNLSTNYLTFTIPSAARTLFTDFVKVADSEVQRRNFIYAKDGALIVLGDCKPARIASEAGFAQE